MLKDAEVGLRLAANVCLINTASCQIRHKLSSRTGDQDWKCRKTGSPPALVRYFQRSVRLLQQSNAASMCHPQMLRQVQWAHLMVDEAHRLKNNESALYQVRVFSAAANLLISSWVAYPSALPCALSGTALIWSTSAHMKPSPYIMRSIASSFIMHSRQPEPR